MVSITSAAAKLGLDENGPGDASVPDRGEPARTPRICDLATSTSEQSLHGASVDACLAGVQP